MLYRLNLLPLSALCLLLFLSCTSKKPETNHGIDNIQKPNVILVITDDEGDEEYGVYYTYAELVK